MCRYLLNAAAPYPKAFGGGIRQTLGLACASKLEALPGEHRKKLKKKTRNVEIHSRGGTVCTYNGGGPGGQAPEICGDCSTRHRKNANSVESTAVDAVGLPVKHHRFLD